MDKAQLIDFIKNLEVNLEIKEGKQFVEVTVPPASLHNLARLLKEKEETKFDFLFCISGVDYGKDLAVVYHLRSSVFDHVVVLKALTSDREHPQVESLADLWPAAEFHEREVFDLLGIRFLNHPDLRRLFLDNSFGYPLRKDYVDDINIVTK